MNRLSEYNREIDAILQSSSRPEIDLFQYYTSKAQENSDIFVLALIGALLAQTMRNRTANALPAGTSRSSAVEDSESTLSPKHPGFPEAELPARECGLRHVGLPHSAFHETEDERKNLLSDQRPLWRILEGY
ncbi:MAG: hypothetical protein LBU11_06280 [Zoogloeaceae bacterium]|jgi:hypothetical protein|nr:hypothetical protein [Zoogloeaceae bacterium]